MQARKKFFLICLRLEKKPNKAFKSDSQRLAVSLRSSIAKRRSHLNAALYCPDKFGYLEL
ncbi:hypothetical protein DZF88_12280 [Vibrio parahaemolyticus]|nr:hypothetical protein [Vibrio parahaemolyticus]EGR3033128.1 hypothetical protein [Vibrio parahaemolyticus]EGR3179416.1 hypothetical protein [Vibrio parahaemolyticus]